MKSALEGPEPRAPPEFPAPQPDRPPPEPPLEFPPDEAPGATPEIPEPPGGRDRSEDACAQRRACLRLRT